jgi:predicted ATPase
VLIVGEPGIGKSRLVEEFRAQLGETPHSWIEWSSSQLLQNTPLHPVLGWGRARFGGLEVPPERRLADLESVRANIKLDAAEHAPLVAPLVDIPVPPERLPSLPPDEVHSRQLAAMVAWAIAGARAQPLVLVFEDMQWFDPTSIDLVRALSDRGAQAPLLILATARAEFRSPWSLRPHHSVISLTPLDDAQVQRMVAELARQRTLSSEVIKGVSERAGGVPLFVEEVTRLLLERGEQGGPKAIPPTLRQSLAARLDRLGSAREVAQIGAVLGRSFSYAVLRNVASHAALVNPGHAGPGEAGDKAFDEGLLQIALGRLLVADLLFVEGVPPEAIYRFKHALIQDSAYDSLLKSRRQTLHRRAAEALIEANEEPEAVASSLYRGRARRSCDRVVEQGGRRRAAPLGLQGGDRTSRPSDRDGRKSGASGYAARTWRRRCFEPTSEVAYRLWSCSDVVERLCRRRNGRRLRARQRAREIGGRI